jgi:hypothetical protein
VISKQSFDMTFGKSEIIEKMLSTKRASFSEAPLKLIVA